MKNHKMLLCSALLGTFGFIGLSQEAAADTVDMYRLYNPNTGEHLYTADAGERDHLIPLGWQDEGLGWTAPAQGEAVYRLYNPNAGEHFYTLSLMEYNQLKDFGWKQEGQAFYSATTKDIPVYRLYNPNQFAFNHHYTQSQEESDWLDGLGWNYEGIGWYGVEDTRDTNNPATTFTVTLQYHDAAGNDLRKSEVVRLQAGADYTATAPTISGYTLTGKATQEIKNIQSNQTLTFNYQNTNVTPPVVDNSVTVNAVYKDGNTDEVIANDHLKLEKGASFTAEIPEGYQVYGQDVQLEYSNLDSDLTVEYICVPLTDIYEVTEDEGSLTATIERTNQENQDVTEMNIPNYVVRDEVVYEVTAIGEEAFIFNINLEKVTIGKNIKSIGGWSFSNLQALTEVTLPEGLLSIGNNAFEYTGLNSINIPDSVETIGGAAFMYSKLQQATIGSGVKKINSAAFSYTFSMTEVTLKEGLEEIEGSAFIDAGLTSLTIPDSVKIIGMTAFANNQQLHQVTLGSGVESMEYGAFSNNPALTQVNFREGIKAIGDMAFYLTAINSIDVPDSVETIGYGAFETAELVNISIPAQFADPEVYTLFLPYEFNPENGLVIRD